MKNQQDFFFPTSASFYKDATRERESNQRSIRYIIHTFSGKLIPQIFVMSVASPDSDMNYRETKAFFKNLSQREHYTQEIK